ncbi:MAG: hypothetical protein KAJ66_04645 [Candidatus Omnitrophica bacterium]|nr:hypothetical protein [Candidatus Omnitrophota bacterium]
MENSTNDLLKHSGFGISSFVISLVIGVGEIFVIGIAAFLGAQGQMSEENTAMMVVGLAIMAGLMINLAGVGLAIAGICQKNKKKMFSILGLIFNGVLILGIVGLIIIGMMVS